MIESHFHVTYNHDTNLWEYEDHTQWSATCDGKQIYDTGTGEWVEPDGSIGGRDGWATDQLFAWINEMNKKATPPV